TWEHGRERLGHGDSVAEEGPDRCPGQVQAGSAGQNKQHLVTKNTAKLDRETEELHHERVSLEVGKVIQKGRQDKGMTQKDLATKINEKPQVIADYESGKAIPNNQVMGKVERAIGLKLRGKDIGQPLEAKPKKK
uniref:HTH cro/C1-type domain-containing protein n=1 Tax=Sphaeramia orbicularis TaxID=375764 RepID=A0A673A6G6_9TELE